MRISVLVLGVSFVANVCLAAFVYSRAAGVSGSRSNVAAERKAAEPGSPVTPPAPLPESDAERDANYVVRLRADDFPPDVIRTLVYARLQQRYAGRLQALRKKGESPYWRSPALGVSFSLLDPEDRVAARALYQQLSAEAKALLGDGDEALFPYEKDRRERLMGNLSSAKVRQVEAIEKDYSELAMMLRDRAKGVMLKSDRERFRLLEQEKRADLAAALAPEELAEYDLRGSPSAQGTRSRLRYFEPDEAEFRAIASLRLDIDLKYGGAYATAEEQKLRAAAEKELPAKIQALLSPERFAEYLITTDGAFSETSAFATAAELDPKVAREVIGVKQDLTKRADAIREDAALSAEQKNSQLAALSEEARARVTAAIGETNFAAYKQRMGSWMNRLSPKPAAPARSQPP